MSPPLALLWLAEGTGAGFGPVLDRLSACLRPGDSLVLVDAGGADDIAARQARHFAWGGGAGGAHVTRILARGGTWEEAADLALQVFETDTVQAQFALFLGPAPRLDPAAFDRARARLAETEADALRLSWPDLDAPPGATLFSSLVHRDLLRGLRPAACGLAHALWQIAARASRPIDHAEPLGAAGPLPPPGPDLAHELPGLLAAEPGAAPFVAACLPAWRRLTGPAARSAWAGAWPALARTLPPLPPDPGPVAPAALAAPARGGTPLRVHRAGRHAHRTPFAYPPLAPLWEGRIAVQPDPGGADLVVFSHPRDPLDLDLATARAIEAGARVALLSEEPFWDSLFSPDPLAARVTLPAGHLGELALPQINHHTSPLFDWEHLPYYLLAEEGMIDRLLARLAAPLPPGPRPIRTAFMAERRLDAFHDVALPRGDLLGLCAFRTRLALAVTTGPVARMGASWEGGPTRFDLGNWHEDKLARLAGRVAILSGIENTHQPTYLSEKLFDAIACGAGALYMASAGHSVHRLGLPQEAWLNLWGMDVPSAAAAVDGWQPGDLAPARATLARRLGDAAALGAERARLGQALLAACDAIMADER